MTGLFQQRQSTKHERLIITKPRPSTLDVTSSLLDKPVYAFMISDLRKQPAKPQLLLVTQTSIRTHQGRQYCRDVACLSKSLTSPRLRAGSSPLVLSLIHI